MAQWIPDDIDFAAYEHATDCQVKIRAASVFAEDLEAEFNPPPSARRASMTSTKLRHAIEFRPGEVTVWAGGNGHRKSMFTGQLALDLCAQRERTLVISLEMAPRKTLARMARQACAAASPNADRRAEFLRWTDDKLWLFDHIGSLTPPKCLAVCRYFAETLNGAHVFIDSFMKVCKSEESLDEQKQMVGDICDVAKETGLHIHLIAHCKKFDETQPPTKYDIRGSASITDQPHNVAMVWQNIPKRDESEKQMQDPKIMAAPDAVISLTKQRNGSVEGKFGMWFDAMSLRFLDRDGMDPLPYDMNEVTA